MARHLLFPWGSYVLGEWGLPTKGLDTFELFNRGSLTTVLNDLDSRYFLRYATKNQNFNYKIINVYTFFNI